MPGHRQAKAHVAPFADQPVHALALAADDDAHRLCEIELPWSRLTPYVESRAPDTGSLHLRDRRRDARYGGDGEQLAGARACLYSRRRQRSAAVLWDDGALGPGHLATPQDGAPDLRVHR